MRFAFGSIRGAFEKKKKENLWVGGTTLLGVYWWDCVCEMCFIYTSGRDMPYGVSTVDEVKMALMIMVGRSCVGLHRNADESTWDVGRRSSWPLHQVPKYPQDKQVLHLDYTCSACIRIWLCDTSQVLTVLQAYSTAPLLGVRLSVAIHIQTVIINKINGR